MSGDAISTIGRLATFTRSSVKFTRMAVTPRLSDPDFDVKLGRGGVREIEFFTQVQQLILGGRHPFLRASGTKTTLARMAGDGVITQEVGENLTIAYDFLRSVEHRIQMVNDEQTHRLPDIPAKRAQIASLSGYQSQADFELDLSNVRGEVHGVYSDLFATEERLSGEAGNLVFTGVDDDPGTVATLKALGFSDPSRVIATLSALAQGRRCGDAIVAWAAIVDLARSTPVADDERQ